MLESSRQSTTASRVLYWSRLVAESMHKQHPTNHHRRSYQERNPEFSHLRNQAVRHSGNLHPHKAGELPHHIALTQTLHIMSLTLMGTWRFNSLVFRQKAMTTIPYASYHPIYGPAKLPASSHLFGRLGSGAPPRSISVSAWSYHIKYPTIHKAENYWKRMI